MSRSRPQLKAKPPKCGGAQNVRMNLARRRGSFPLTVAAIVVALAISATALPQGHESPSPGTLVALPFSRGKEIFTSRVGKSGGVDFCVQEGAEGKPRLLVDSATDPFIAKYPLPDFAVSDDGRFLAHFQPQADDARFESIPIIDIKTGQPLPDQVKWTHDSDFSWHGRGFYYGLYPTPSSSEDKSEPPYHDETIMFHRLGRAQSKDEIVYRDAANPTRKYLFLNTFDQRWLLVHALERADGKRYRTELFRREGKGNPEFTTFIQRQEGGATYLIDDVDGKLLLQTTYKAAQGRLILVDPKKPDEANWKQIVPEGTTALIDGNPVLGKMVLILPVASGGSRAAFFDLHGKHLSDIPTEPGTNADVQFGRKNERYGFLSTQKGSGPKSYFLYDPATGKLTPFR
jgi:prolyl oligopeptidase